MPRKKTVRFRPHGELRAAVNPGLAAAAEGPAVPAAGAELQPPKQP